MEDHGTASQDPFTVMVSEVLAEATGRDRRADPVLPGTGGPAGNALLTAWTALVLLVLSVAELLTLFDVRGLISWHVALGALFVPPAVMKTASTGWRMVRYYTGAQAYREAGPPPMVLRVLAPLVVVSTLGLLGSGVLLILIGEERARQTLVSGPLLSVDWVTLHQFFFALWCGATGLHLLGRIVPALRITLVPGPPTRVPGSWVRVLLLVSMAASAAALAVVLVHVDGSWAHPSLGDLHRLGVG